MERQNVIELNGKRYDAVTGALLGASKTPVISAVAKHHANKGKVIDGFIRPTKSTLVATPVKVKTITHVPGPKTTSKKVHAAAISEPKPTPKPEVTAVKTSAKAHHTANNAQAHHPEHAKTLMRRAVHKPEVAMKQAIKVQAPAEVAARPMSAIAHKRSAYQLDAHKLEHAQQVAQHDAIQHFRPHHTSTEAAAHPTPHHAPITPTLAVRSVPAPVVQRPATQSKPAHADVFEAAIARATSHEQPAHRPRRARHRRLVNAMAGIGAFLVIGGFIAYLNMPNLELRVASFQAGFGAQMPGYAPTGFAMRGGVQRTGNTVSMKYQSGDQAYTITQQASDWNSQTLVENTLALNGEHKTVQSGGRTIYVYGGSNAVWVDGNVRYDVTGNAPLSDDDITTLASSL